jgi:hypothetical protein
VVVFDREKRQAGENSFARFLTSYLSMCNIPQADLSSAISVKLPACPACGRGSLAQNHKA